MRSAMARFLTVNDFSASPPVPRGNLDFNLDPEQAAADSEFGVEPDSVGVGPNSGGIEPASYGIFATRGGGIASATGKNRNDQGPCLYFGPQGQRCSRPAIANGFCARHTPAQLGQPGELGQSAKGSSATYPRPGGAALGSRPLGRIIAIGIAIFAALWPVVADLLREIFRWLHAH
jgi:hypothetical protein